MKESITNATNEVTPKLETSKNKWITDEILILMAKRGKNKNYEQYKKINSKIKQKCNETKDSWLNKKHQAIENNINKDSRSVHQNMNKLCGRKTLATTGYLGQRQER